MGFPAGSQARTERINRADPVGKDEDSALCAAASWKESWIFQGLAQWGASEAAIAESAGSASRLLPLSHCLAAQSE